MSQKKSHKSKKTGGKSTRFSRRTFIGGMAAGALGAWGAMKWLDYYGEDPDRPPDLYEYFLDNFWFETVDLYHQKINPPLKGSHKADIVIIGADSRGFPPPTT